MALPPLSAPPRQPSSRLRGAAADTSLRATGSLKTAPGATLLPDSYALSPEVRAERSSAQQRLVPSELPCCHMFLLPFLYVAGTLSHFNLNLYWGE